MPKRIVARASLVLLLGVIAISLLSSDRPLPAATPVGRTEALPAPRLDGPVSLEAALQTRRSVRSFLAQPLTPGEIGQLLWAAQGITDAAGHRTAPSAGATYPLELDVVTADGVARYLPDGHRLTWRGASDLRPALRRAALDQEVVGGAPLAIVIVGMVDRTAARYGDRAGWYVALEAGHAAQNILLEAVALGLGAVPVGAFDDEALARVLGLGAGESPLYLVAVGHPG
jgi:SagB-type dehydrogenase family enzyme